jgi:hypothetical protein
MDAIPKRGVALLEDMPVPRGWKAADWNEFVTRCFSFRMTHGAEAHKAGWSAVQLFGLSRSAPGNHYAMGAVPRLVGFEVVELDAERMMVRRPDLILADGEVKEFPLLRLSKRAPWWDATEAWNLQP